MLVDSITPFCRAHLLPALLTCLMIAKVLFELPRNRRSVDYLLDCGKCSPMHPNLGGLEGFVRALKALTKSRQWVVLYLLLVRVKSPASLSKAG